MQTEIKLPVYEGSSFSFLEGPFGETFYKIFKGRVRLDFNNNPALNVLKYDKGVVTGSNDYAVVLAYEILREEGLKTVNQAEIEKALKNGSLPLKGMNVDTSVVLRTHLNPNHFIADDLMNQVKKRSEIEIPIMIPLRELILKTNGNFPDGLGFTLREDAKLIYAPILNDEGGHFTSKDIDEKIGLPKETCGGDRYLYTTVRGGLSRLCLLENSNISSGKTDLNHSHHNGRIVIFNDKN